MIKKLSILLLVGILAISTSTNNNTIELLGSALHTNLLAYAATKEELQNELKQLEAEVAQHKELIAATQKQGASLNRDIKVLDLQIKKSEAEIKIRQNTIKKLDAKINEGESTVDELNDKIDDSKESLEDAIRTENMLSTQNSLLYLFGSKSLSAIFDNIGKYKEVQDALNTHVVEIKEDKAKLEETIEALEDSKAEQGAVVQTTLLAKKMVESNKTEKKTLLAETKGQEAIYTANLKNKEKEIAKVRAALFELSGSKSINFGSAYDIAIQMEKLTGVRAAYLMALVTVESNLGKNVGTGNWKTDMHPTRDQPLFKTICEELGLSPDDQKVSKKAWYGYGGAMGPAQFIPSTWVSYKDKVSAVTGNTPANPWNTRDAFAAAALLLKDNGATSGASNAEHRAAVCYLAGCGNASKAAYQFYGNDVMSIAAKYEDQIKLLNSN